MGLSILYSEHGFYLGMKEGCDVCDVLELGGLRGNQYLKDKGRIQSIYR